MALTMKELEAEYEKLKQSIVNLTEPPAFTRKDSAPHLDRLKEQFESDVHSLRQLDAVDSVAGLIRLLEKRLLLGWFQPERLQYILQEFDIIDGDTSNMYIEFGDHLLRYRLKNKSLFSTTPHNPDYLREVPHNNDIIPKPVADHVCKEIGGKWLEFGKEMVRDGIASEGDLDELRNDKISIEDKTQKLLDLFIKGDQRNSRSHLCEILSRHNVNIRLGEEVLNMFLKEQED